MANRRMIASDIFEDEDIGRLEYLARLVWIGLFSVVADDQGRMMNSPALVRSKVFLYDLDKVSDENVEKAIRTLSDKGKIICYEKANKKLIQIIKWWTYQTPSWAMPSKYPAPNNWTDRCKYHAPGNKIVITNWDQQGGICSELRSGQSRVIEEGNGKVEGNGNDDGDVEVKDEKHDNNPQSQLLKIFSEHTKLDCGTDAEKIALELIQKGVIQSDIINAINFMNSKPEYKCVSFKSIRAPALIEMERRKNNKKKSDPEDYTRYLKGEYGEFGKH